MNRPKHQKIRFSFVAISLTIGVAALTSTAVDLGDAGKDRTFGAGRVDALAAVEQSDTDSDNDGLSDEEESSLGTDPLDRDTDGDSVDDGLEVELRLNPLDPNDCPADYCPRQSIVLKILPLLATTDTGPATVLIQTPLGDIEFEMLSEAAPGTVANFLKYVNDGDYQNSFIHRSVPGFIIQGGGFTFEDGSTGPVPTDPPIANEFSVSNTRGTVAMAKLNGSPDSATSQWFINLVDNSENLDNQNGGFTVFARVTGNGMAVADAIAALPIYQLNNPFGDIPLINYDPSELVEDENLVFTNIVTD